MPKILRRQRAGYALSLVFFLMGLIALIVALRETWPEVSSADSPLSTFWTLLWREQLSLVPNVEFKLGYLVILGTAMFVSGIIVLAMSRQWFHLPAGEIVLLQCPFCRKRWRGHRDHKLVNCPHCRKQTYPAMVEK